jgi:phosphoglycerol transferase MdoB-like AlkP superfamily enzyme
MDELLRFIAFAFSFVVLLPLLIYFVFLSAAPKKTKKEKVIVFVLTVLSVGLMLWITYNQGHSNEIQTFSTGLVFMVGSFLNTFEIQISKVLRVGILIVGVGVYIAAGSYI